MDPVGLLCLLLIGSFSFPVMSIAVPGIPESAVITVNGFGLFEHSLFGLVPVAVAFAVFANICGGKWSTKRRTLAILMLVLSTAAYAVAFSEAKEWLTSISPCDIDYGTGTAIYLVSEVLLSAALIFKRNQAERIV